MSSGSNNRKRHNVIGIRVTDEELQQIQEKAAPSGLTVASYLRLTLLESPPPQPAKPPKHDIDLLRKLLGQVHKIGSNINQLAHAHNRGTPPYAHEVKAALIPLYQVSDALLAALGKRSVNDNRQVNSKGKQSNYPMP